MVNRGIRKRIRYTEDVLEIVRQAVIPADIRREMALDLYSAAVMNDAWRKERVGVFLNRVGLTNKQIVELMSSKKMEDNWWYSRYGARVNAEHDDDDDDE